MSLRPDRDDVVRLALLLAAAVVALHLFGVGFSDAVVLRVAVPSLLAGALVGWALARRRPDPVTALAVAAVVGVLTGAALAVPDAAVGGVLPGPAALAALVDGATAGWRRLVTTAAPADRVGNLHVPVHVVAYLSGLLGVLADVRGAAARGGRAAALLRHAPTGVVLVALVAAVVLGPVTTAGAAARGAVVAALLVVRTATVETQRSRLGAARPTPRRALAAVATLGLLTLLGTAVAGAVVPERTVLRDVVEQPFDPLREPSPLVGYRRYVPPPDAPAEGPASRGDEVLRIDGVPAGTRVRLAVLDDYDGLVWHATGRGDRLAGSFDRVGRVLPRTDAPVEGTPVTAEVQLLDPHGGWLPTVGQLRTVDLAPTLAEELRVALATDTAVLPGGVPPGTTYRVGAVLPTLPDEDELRAAALAPGFARAETFEVPQDVQDVARTLLADDPGSQPYDVLTRLAAGLRDRGAFADGSDPGAPVPPGHSLARLQRFLGAPEFVGDGEQFAAALGLLGLARGLPVRVVVGFVTSTEEPTVVRGADVAAWVEVPLDGVGWVPVDATPPRDDLPSDQPPPPARQPVVEPQPPPPPNLPPPASLPQELDASDTEGDEAPDEDEVLDTRGLGALSRLALPLGLLLLVAGPPSAVVAWKARRRRRRREGGTTVQRAHGGWREVVDLGRDLGRTVPPAATRAEAATLLGLDGAAAVADAADRATFAPDGPSEEELDRLWAEVERVRSAALASGTVLDRARVAVATASLRPTPGGVRGRRLPSAPAGAHPPSPDGSRR